MSNGLKLLLIAASAIIVCIVCVVGFNITKEGKNSVNASTEEYTSLTSQYNEVELAAYDGMTLSGSEVVAVIKKYAQAIEDKEFAGIQVNTKSKTEAVKYNSSTNTSLTAESITEGIEANQLTANKNKETYINPSGKFLGSVTRNDNGMIETILFEQQ